MKNRGIAVVLALFLGGLGIHRFYIGQIGWGFVFLIFSWTIIPVIFGFIDALRYWLMGEVEFHHRYSSMPSFPPPRTLR